MTIKKPIPRIAPIDANEAPKAAYHPSSKLNTPYELAKPYIFNPAMTAHSRAVPIASRMIRKDAYIMTNPSVRISTSTITKINIPALIHAMILDIVNNV